MRLVAGQHGWRRYETDGLAAGAACVWGSVLQQLVERANIGQHGAGTAFEQSGNRFVQGASGKGSGRFAVGSHA
jgi:hypothetical protein